MANVEAAVFAQLQATPSVVALIGKRAYPEAAPPNADMPYVIFQVQDEARDPVGNLVNAVVEVNCYAEKQPVATSLKEAVRALHGAHGVMGGQNVRGMFCENVASPYEVSPHNANVGFFVKAINLRVFIGE